MESLNNSTIPLLSSDSDEKGNIRHTKVKMYGYCNKIIKHILPAPKIEPSITLLLARRSDHLANLTLL